jgi:hypothetical protein
MRTELFGALPRFELGGRWRWRGDREAREMEMVRERETKIRW